MSDYPTHIWTESVLGTWNGWEYGAAGGPIYRDATGRVVVASDHNGGTAHWDVPAQTLLLHVLERAARDLAERERTFTTGTPGYYGGEGIRPAAYRAGLRYVAEQITAYLDALPPLPPLDGLGYVLPA